MKFEGISGLLDGSWVIVKGFFPEPNYQNSRILETDSRGLEAKLRVHRKHDPNLWLPERLGKRILG